MAKEPIIHTDILGRELLLGDCVAYSAGSRSLRLGLVDKLHPKMIRVKTKGSTSNQYPKETIKVDGPDVTMYILRGFK